MAKQPEEVDHFTVQIERVPREMMGDLLGDLAKRNLTNVKYELVTDVLKFKQKVMNEIPGRDFLRAWIEAGQPTFEIYEAVQHFRADGRSPAACYTAARNLVQEGFLKKLGSGNYSLASVKHIAAPKKAKAVKPAKPTKIQRDHFDVDHRTFILRQMSRNHGRRSYMQLVKAFEDDGRKKSSISGAIGYMTEHKMIKSDGDGNYTLLSKGGAKAKPAKSEPIKKANGNGSHIETPATESVTNG